MSIFPITPLVRQVRTLIVETFEVPEAVAQDYAAELVSLAEGWGSPEYAAAMDWPYRIRKDFGEKLKWRSEAERQRFEDAERRKYQAYEFFISGRNRG